MAKRTLDIAVATIVLLLSLPLLLSACVAIYLETPGSPFYIQSRSGRGGRTFPIIKLRTMVRNADQIGPALTQGSDCRVTRVGSILRRWSIDELPQMLNVLAGHMSIVGPRPEIVPITATYTALQRQVLRARPGLTGWAQVNGRDDLSIPGKIDLELNYLATRNMLRDLAILAKTVRVVLSGNGIKKLVQAVSDRAFRRLCTSDHALLRLGHVRRRMIT